MLGESFRKERRWESALQNGANYTPEIHSFFIVLLTTEIALAVLWSSAPPVTPAPMERLLYVRCHEL